MAKRDGVKLAKSRITLLAVHLEGDHQTAQEGLRTLSHALGNLIKQPRLLLPKPEDQALGATEDTEEADEQEITTDSAESPASEVSSESRRPRSIKAPEVVVLDLTGGSVSLEQFCKQKGIGESDPDSKRYLVIMSWLKEHRGLASINANHIYTCYRHMSWHTPQDPSQPLRAMKHNNGWVSKAEGKGNYSLNHLGENEVRKMSQVIT